MYNECIVYMEYTHYMFSVRLNCYAEMCDDDAWRRRRTVTTVGKTVRGRDAHSNVYLGTT